MAERRDTNDPTGYDPPSALMLDAGYMRVLRDRDEARQAVQYLKAQLIAGIALHTEHCHAKDECPWVMHSRKVIAEWADG